MNGLTWCNALLTFPIGDIFLIEYAFTELKVCESCMSEVSLEKTSKERSESCPLRVHQRIFFSSPRPHPTSAPRHDSCSHGNEDGSKATDHISVSFQREHRFHLDYPGGTYRFFTWINNKTERYVQSQKGSRTSSRR